MTLFHDEFAPFSSGRNAFPHLDDGCASEFFAQKLPFEQSLRHTPSVNSWPEMVTMPGLKYALCKHDLRPMWVWNINIRRKPVGGREEIERCRVRLTRNVLEHGTDLSTVRVQTLPSAKRLPTATSREASISDVHRGIRSLAFARSSETVMVLLHYDLVVSEKLCVRSALKM